MIHQDELRVVRGSMHGMPHADEAHDCLCCSLAQSGGVALLCELKRLFLLRLVGMCTAQPSDNIAAMEKKKCFSCLPENHFGHI